MSKPAPWELDPTYLEQTGLDPQQVWKQITAGGQKSAQQSTSSSSQPTASSPSPGSSTPLSPNNTATPNTATHQMGSQIKNISTSAQSQPSPPTGGSLLGFVLKNVLSNISNILPPSSGGQKNLSPSSAPGSQDDSQSRDSKSNSYRRRSRGSLSLLLTNITSSSSAEPQKGAPGSPDSSRSKDSTQTAGGLMSVDHLLDQRNPENTVNRLMAVLEQLKSQLGKTVSNYRDVLQYSGNTVTMSPKLQNMVDRYKQAMRELNNLPKLESMLMESLGDMVLVVDEEAGPPDLRLPPDKLNEWLKRAKNAKVIVIRSKSGVDIKFAPEIESVVRDVGNLFADIKKLGDDYWKKIHDTINQFNSSGRYKLVVKDDKLEIDTSVHEEGFKKIKQLNTAYDAKLKMLAMQYGAEITVGKDGKLTVVLADPSKHGEFNAKLDALNKWYNDELSKILKEHGLKVEDDKIVVDMSIYSGVFSKIDEINQWYNEMLKNIYSKYGQLLDKTTDKEGRTIYVLKPNVRNALEIYNSVGDIVNTHNTAIQNMIQDVVNRYKDVLAYDPKTGRVGPSKELSALLDRYEQAAQEVNRLVNTMSAVVGMISTFAQQLPVLKVQFMTYDAEKKSFVLGGKTPIYINDPEKRKEFLDWLNRQGVDQQGNPNVDVKAFVDPQYNIPVVYISGRKTGDGYIIVPTAGQVQRVNEDVMKYAESHMQSIWLSSLSPKELEQYVQAQQLEHLKNVSKRELEKLPPVVREVVGTLVTAGQYLFVPEILTLKGVLFGDKDPLLEAKKFYAVVKGIGEASPITTYTGTAFGIGTMVAGAGASLLARGAAKLAAQGAKNVVEDIAKFAVVKKPEFSVLSPIQHVQQTAKAPTLLQTAAAGLKDAAVPMAISGAAFGGLEGVKSYLETGKVDIPRVLTGAAFGSLMGAFPITKMQALTALGIGAGAAAGAGLVRGYDLLTSLAVGEAAGLMAVVGSGIKGLYDAKTQDVKASGMKVADFAVAADPKGRSRPADTVQLAEVDRIKVLDRFIGRIVNDVITGKLTVEDANLRLGAVRDAVLDKTLFDKILQRYKKLPEPPKVSPLDFDTAVKKAAEVVSAADSGSMPKYAAFEELAKLRISVADKARFDKQFGAKLREYGEQYISWLLGSGLDKHSIVLNLYRYEDALGRKFIEKYMPDYGKALAEVKSKLAQLRPVSPRETLPARLTPEELRNIVESLFKDVLEGRKDFFRASEELYKLWSRLSPDMRAELEIILHDLNIYYGEKFGITLEPWRPPLLESILRRAELAAADVKSVLTKAPKATVELIKSTVKTVEELLSPERITEWRRRMRISGLDEELGDIASSFMRGKISLEEAKKALAELANKYEKQGMKEFADIIREKLKDDEALKRFLNAALGMQEKSKLESTLRIVKSRLSGAKDAVWSAVKEIVPEHRRYTWREWRRAEAEDRLIDLVKRLELGEIDLETARRKALKLIKEIEKKYGRETAEDYRRYFERMVLKKKFDDVVAKFRRGEISPEEARKRLMEIVDEIEKTFGSERADFYRKYAEEVLTGRRAVRAEEKPRLPDEKEREFILRAELDRLGFEFSRVVNEFRLGRISRSEAERRLMQIVKEIERLSDELGDRRWADIYNRKYVEEVLSGKYGGPGVAAKETRRQQLLLLLEEEKPTVRRPHVEQTRHRRRISRTSREDDARHKKFVPPRARPHAVTAEDVEAPKGWWGVVPPVRPTRQVEEAPPQFDKPHADVPTTYSQPRLVVPTAPTGVAVPPPSTYTTSVPTLEVADVPTVGIPTIPTYETTPEPQPTPLPSGWWRFLPPWDINSREGAYNIQFGRKQILTLA